MSKETVTTEFQKLVAQINVLKRQAKTEACKVVGEFEYTPKQIEEMGSVFLKWVNEGQGYDYFPRFKWMFPELEFILEDCIGDYDGLYDIFEPLGVEFE